MMPPPAAVEPRRSLTHTITEEITSWIATGKYKPGDYLPAEGDLARHFNVSKPSVRESLKHLHAIGAVEISHGRPAAVRAMTSVPLVNFFHLAVTAESGGLQEAIELRKGLEIQSVVLAAERATPEDIADLARLIKLLDDAKADLEKWVPLHVEFHAALVRAAHNRFYSFLQEALRETIERTNREILGLNPKRNPKTTFAFHMALFEAIRDHDQARAQAAIEAHFAAVDKVLAAAAKR
ncbi:MAG: FadR/GntR family transcriptional regulator [Pseudomonadota bacterium]